MRREDSHHARISLDRKNPVEFDRFAEDVEKQAHIMQQAGWFADASNLREWVRELRDKTRAAAPR